MAVALTDAGRRDLEHQIRLDIAMFFRDRATHVILCDGEPGGRSGTYTILQSLRVKDAQVDGIDVVVECFGGFGLSEYEVPLPDKPRRLRIAIMASRDLLFAYPVEADGDTYMMSIAVRVPINLDGIEL